MRIKEIREKKNISQRALARKAEMSQTFLSNVENGKSDPSLSTLKRLAEALKTKVSKLIEDE